MALTVKFFWVRVCQKNQGNWEMLFAQNFRASLSVGCFICQRMFWSKTEIRPVNSGNKLQRIFWRLIHGFWVLQKLFSYRYYLGTVVVYSLLIVLNCSWNWNKKDKQFAVDLYSFLIDPEVSICIFVISRFKK